MPPSPPSSASRSDSTDTPPRAPIPIPPSTSKKRGREVPEVEGDNDNGNIRLPPSKTPAISPDSFSGDGSPPRHPPIPELTSLGDRSRGSMELALQERLGMGLGDDPSPFDGPAAQTIKRTRVGEEVADPKIMDFATITPPVSAGLQTPQTDPYSQALGVGWTKMPDDPDTLAAVRGYCRYIENHYPLTGVEILTKSASMDSYLVRTTQGYYLFDDNLTEGKFIAKDFETTLELLKPPTLRFGGATLRAADAPSSSGSGTGASDVNMMDTE
ncbi:hypothetical protein ACLMJK_007508 [Lecanora helva]